MNKIEVNNGGEKQLVLEDKDTISEKSEKSNQSSYNDDQSKQKQDEKVGIAARSADPWRDGKGTIALVDYSVLDELMGFMEEALDEEKQNNNNNNINDKNNNKNNNNEDDVKITK